MITQLRRFIEAIEGNNDENLRWILDRQKNDNTEMKKQARRYILSILSALVVLIGIWYSTDDLLPSQDAVATSLTEYGVFWQLDLLPPDYATAFVNSFYIVPLTFTAIGASFLFISIGIAYLIDQSPSCKPAGSAIDLLNDEREAVLDWIEYNDELIESNELRRTWSMSMGRIGTVLVIMGFFLITLLTFTAFLYILFVIYATLYLFNYINNTEYLKDSLLGITLPFLIIFLLLTRVVNVYQEITGYSSSPLSTTILLVICIIIPLLYVRKEIRGYLSQLWNKYLSGGE